MVMTWFISGLVLAYVPFPKMSSAEKLRYLRPINWSAVHVTPASSLAVLGLTEFPQEMRLEMSGVRPVYRIKGWDKRNYTVAADTGDQIRGVSSEEALAIVRQQLATPQATIKAANIDSDQWTMTGYWNKERPFHVIALNDADGSEYHVSVRTGEVVLGTTRIQRILNWFGAIPHWLYFEPVRRYTHEGIWTWLIYIFAGAGIFVSISGLWIGISRMRLRARYTNGSWTPFRGWMKWHHVTGILGGITLALWLVSGFFTMYPGGFLEQRDVEKTEYKAYAGSTSPDFRFDALSGVETSGAPISRATLRYVGGRPYAILEQDGVPPRVVDAMTGVPAPFSVTQIADAASRMLPNAHLVSTQYLIHGDEYWHSAYHLKKTPIARVVFDDPNATWFHIDPESGEILGILDKTGRVDRWTVVAIHDVDWNWLLTRRPLWDLVLFAVTIPGILIALSTLVISYRRLQRNNLIPAFAGTSHARVGRSENLEGELLSKDRPASTTRIVDTVLVAFASQTGTAEILANKTADSLRLAGMSARVCELGDLEAADLTQAAKAIFVVATTGDGDPPDRSLSFRRRLMRGRLPLKGLQYALLALGDRQYTSFCSFGVALDRWLAECGARRMFESVHVDDREASSLGKWALDVSGLTGRVDDFSLNEAPFRPWRLVDRSHLNPGSAGGPTFHVRLHPDGGAENWEAGDIAQIIAGLSWSEFRTREHGLIQREFSIANTASDGIDLLIRQMRTPDGRLGIASGFLTERAELGTTIPLRVRRNPSFHGPIDDCPLLLIGNGTGIAGLRAHLQRRVSVGQHRNWLIFGERNAAHDFFYGDELRQWASSGHLERLDLVFSRDGGRHRYVQDLLTECKSDVRSWVARGAAIYVCGSVRGMAPAVSEHLGQILGADQLEELTKQRRYMRDVY
jgi:sulfite reductase (NADPH) flavoprotein alpha-component